MALSSGLGYVNFINGDGENRPVRCGRMYYTCFLPICGLFRSKTSPVYHVKNPPFSTFGGYWGGSGLLRQD